MELKCINKAYNQWASLKDDSVYFEVEHPKISEKDNLIFH